MIWINGYRIYDYEQFLDKIKEIQGEWTAEFSKANNNNPTEEPKVKELADYTLREIKQECPFTNKNFKDDSMTVCDNCHWNFMCCMSPDEWDFSRKPALAEEEKEKIRNQIKELQEKLGE